MSWIAWPGAQEEFLSRSEFEVLFGGSAGPGKTDCLVAALTRDIDKPKYRGLIIRRTFPQLQEVIDRCHRLYPHMGGNFKATEKRWYFPSGAIIDLGHMQHESDKYNYQGKEYQKIGVDELTQFLESMYTYLFSRLRTTDPDINPQILSTTNPGGIGHYWVKERFVTITDHKRAYIDPKTGLDRVFIPATIEDNPTLYDNDPAYLARLESLPEIEKQRLRYGIWDSFEGQIFTELSQRLHGCVDFDIPPEWERYCVFDWGFSKPFSVQWYAMDYDGVMYLYREWYGLKEGEIDVGLKLPAYKVAQGILEREKPGEKIKMRIADPSIWHPRPESRKGEARGTTIHEDFVSQGVFFIKADNDRVHGKQQVHKRFRIEQDVDKTTGEITGEHPMFQAFHSCKHFWRTMMILYESPNNPEDVDTDQEDHPYDTVRYMCMARPILPKKYQKVPPGSFMAERNRLIRAKDYAKRHGVSMAAAYQRIR
jgi:hypothetical protein